MKARINFELPDGSQDSIIVSGGTPEEIFVVAEAEIEKRGGSNPWSEILDEQLNSTTSADR